MDRTILVPHDGGSMSDLALKYALEIAQHMNMKIKLIRVIPEIMDIAAFSFWNNTERKRVKKEVDIMKREAQDAEYEKLQKQISLINSRGVKGTALVMEGIDIVDKIIEEIQKERPYIVVIGSKRLRQRGRFSKLHMLGSVAKRLSEQSPKPILIVK